MTTRTLSSRLNTILEKVISGQVSLDCRKRLAAGEVVTVKLGEEEFTIEVQDNQALLMKGTDIVLEKAFIPWGPADDDYVAMIESFGDKGEVDEDWFQRAASAFQDRF